MQLYRPVGLLELQRIYEQDMRAFPSRLPEQPFFYPVLNAAYAAQIASRWNTSQPPYAGYVTQWSIDDSYVMQFERKIVGARMHEELWVPAEELATFNMHIVGTITVGEAFFGSAFRGYVPTQFGMRGRDAWAQLATLIGMWTHNRVDAYLEILANRLAVFLHLPFWKQTEASLLGIHPDQKVEIIAMIETVWNDRFPETPLPDARLAPNE